MSACLASGRSLSKLGLAMFVAMCEKLPLAPVTLISPVSIGSSLALALAGSTPGGSAEAELSRLLGAHEQIAEAIDGLLSSARGNGSGVSLRVANGVWAGTAVRPKFIESATRIHRAQAAPLPSSYEPVNSWVQSRTDGEVPKLLSGTPDPLTVSLLVSAVSFKGVWAERFERERTAEGAFWPLSPGAATASQPANFMRRKGAAWASPTVAALGGAAALRLDYGDADAAADSKGAGFCALFVLPAEAGEASLAATIAALRTAPSPVDTSAAPADPLSAALSTLRRREVDVSIPRFTAEWGASSLKTALRALGLLSAFDGSGQFLELSDEPDLHLDEVLHAARVEVNEEGTAAAAATVAEMGVRSLPPRPLELRFSRPFLLAVLHEETGTPLFVGRINSPQFS